jgi:hypothetical protein
MSTRVEDRGRLRLGLIYAAKLSLAVAACGRRRNSRRCAFQGLAPTVFRRASPSSESFANGPRFIWVCI